MNIILLGSGGREHAFSKKIKESDKVDNLFIIPGNAGTEEEGQNIDIDINNFKEIAKFANSNNVEMIIVGPEDPIANGIHDYFIENYKNIKIIGPKRKAAQLESSKNFAKEFMQKHNIPTAKYKTFTLETLDKAFQFLDSLKSPYVLKADGLAAGKGVVILNDIDEAKLALKNMLNGQFGTASKKVVIEQFLDGIELSAFIITDGKSYKILPEAKDYKRIGEADTGLNTGGMGAVSPVPFANKEFLQKIENKIIKPTIAGLQKDNIDYTGFIFFGIIKVDDEPYVIEYNVRMGDPETEVVFPRIKSDIVEMFLATINGTLYDYNIEISEKKATTIMLVSGGYPEAYKKSKLIQNTKNISDSIIYHAGTKNENERLLTAGGRVIAVTSLADNISEALKISYKNAQIIKFEGKNYRKDIGFDLDLK